MKNFHFYEVKKTCLYLCDHYEFSLVIFGLYYQNYFSLIIQRLYYQGIMLTNKSPEKENRSPERLRKGKLNKQLKTLQQLIQIIKAHGISLPSHLAPEGFNNYQPEYPKDNQEIRSLKVKLADYEFQIKKIEEDFAEFKLLAKIEKDRCTKKLRQELEEQRAKSMEENRRWEKDFKHKNQQHYRQTQDLKNQLKKCNQTIISLTELKQKNQKHILGLYQQQKEKEELHQQNILNLKNQFQKYIQEIKQEHKKQLENREEKYQLDLKEQQQVCEVKLLAVQSEKNVEVKLKEEVKNQVIKDHDKLLQEIQNFKKIKLKLSDEVDSLKMKTKVLNKRLEDKGIEIQRLKKDHEREVQQAQKDRQAELKALSTTWDQEKLALMKNSYSQLEQLQSKFFELEDCKQEMEQTYRDMLNSVQLKFDQRQSKKEDIETIKEIQQEVEEHKRQKNEIYNQLRLMQLQNQNNEKLYTRIFTNKREKKSISQRVERDWLVRQCQTTDLRTILKINRK